MAAARSKARVEAVACFDARDKVAACSGTGIKDSRRRRRQVAAMAPVAGGGGRTVSRARALGGNEKLLSVGLEILGHGA
jgi:hypothetical protein